MRAAWSPLPFGLALCVAIACSFCAVARPGAAEPGAAEPGAAEPGAAEPGAAEPGEMSAKSWDEKPAHDGVRTEKAKHHGGRPTRGPHGADGHDSGALYDVGKLPKALALRWPARPRITRGEVEVATAAEFQQASRRGGSRLVVVQSLSGEALVKGSDIEVTMRDGVEIEKLRIDHGQRRILIRGGRYGQILLSHPAQFQPVKAPRPEWIIEDVIIDGVTIDAEKGSAIEAYGRRIAVLNSDIRAQNYSLWSGPVLGIGSEDILIAHNRMSSAGPESTLRLVDVLRSVTVDNVLRNEFKHTYRVHGRSDLAYAARNTFINTGVMFGTMPEDDIGEMWFEDNTFFHRENDLFHPGPGRVARLHASGNKAHTSTPRRCFCCEQASSGWRFGKNEILPYREPPPP